MSTPKLDEAVSLVGHGRPLLFAHATIHTLDPVIGNLTSADLMAVGPEIVAVGPGLHTAAEDDNAVVIDCTGLALIPVFSPSISSLTPGNSATLAVVPSPSARERDFEQVIWWPSNAAAIVVDGEFVLLNGVSRAPFVPARAVVMPGHVNRCHRLCVHQKLTADGRYDETRGGREHAFQGSFWIDGNRIVYHEDLGFWAYGRFADGVLHHAGYTFTRQR